MSSLTSLRASSRRDQAPSSFAPTLGRFCESAGVVAAALVDRDGEAVDYAGRTSPFDIRIAAAEWRIILARIQRGSTLLQQTQQFVVRSGDKTFATVVLPEGYALVVQLLPRCFKISSRALDEAVRELCQEAGLVPDRAPAGWSRVEVSEGLAPSRLPQSVWVGKKWCVVEILEHCSSVQLGLRDNEAAYRVRLPSGVEGTLVREPLAHWFAEPGSAFQ